VGRCSSFFTFFSEENDRFVDFCFRFQVLAFCDGTNAAVMPPAQDHKRLLDGDRGPNTGGMGAYCPSSLLSKEELERVGRDTIQKVLDGLRAEGIQYKGEFCCCPNRTFVDWRSMGRIG